MSVATASKDGLPHDTYLNLYWEDGTVLAATPEANVTARNLLENPQAVITLGDCNDVIRLHCDVEAPAAVTPDQAAAFVMKNPHFDPEEQEQKTGERHVWLRFYPHTAWAWWGWIEMDAARRIMRQRHWLT